MPVQLTTQQPPTAAPACDQCRRIVWHIARLTAALVGLVRPLVRYPLTEAECASMGLPLGSTDPAVYCTPLHSASRWRLDLWKEADDGDGQACLHLRVLGCEVEVWYHAGC
jgi:hypothetical protein